MEPRIYLEESLQLHAKISLDLKQSHYLLKVLRRKNKSYIRLFNANDGEWRGYIEGTKSLNVILIEQLKHKLVRDKNITLLFAPVKNPSASFYVQKATELGVTNIIPIITKYSVVKTVNISKLVKIAIEAAEQCERLDIPIIHNVIDFDNMPKVSGKLFMCDPRSEINAIIAMQQYSTNDDAILIGPEGGLSPEEVKALLLDKDYTIPVNLGKNILRAETSMITALSIKNLMT